MKKTYFYVVLTYAIMQLSSFIFAPLLMWLFSSLGFSPNEAYKYASTFWIVFSFSFALLIILYLLRKEILIELNSRASLPWGKYIGWGILGMFLAMFSQSIAVYIMELIGLPLVSENTQSIVEMVEMSFIIIVAPALIGPILEEIVFRKVLFGALMERFGFFISSILSSLVFAIVHVDFTHTLVYVFMGLVFCYLYKKTESIITPILAHMFMNSLVLIGQLNIDKIMELEDKLNTVQHIFGGLL